jgi:hypothetical protein
LEKFRQTLKVRKERAILVGAVLREAGDGDDLAELTALLSIDFSRKFAR